MDYKVTSTAAAAFTVDAARGYSGLTRTYLYENQYRLDWIKAGRRSLITRESLDRLLLELLHETSTAVGTSRRPRTVFGPKPAVKACKREPLSSPGQRDQSREPTDEKL